MVKELVEYMQREWATIANAPFSIIFFALLIFTFAYAVSRWRYSAIIEMLRERLAAKDQQLDEYRERLHLAPSSGSEFGKLSHAELQAEALKFIGILRDWLAIFKKKQMQLHSQSWNAMRRATDEAQRQKLWEEQGDIDVRDCLNCTNEYDAKFKVKAIVLRDELLTRVQHPDPDAHAHHAYENPTNPIGMGMVADDLERLARLLG